MSNDAMSTIMTNEQIIKKINLWQSAGFLVGALTCGNNTRHKKLVPEEINGKVVLVCPDCNYRQEQIPNYIFQVKMCPHCGVKVIPKEQTCCSSCDYFD